jgi:hypothetical protein
MSWPNADDMTPRRRQPVGTLWRPPRGVPAAIARGNKKLRDAERRNAARQQRNNSEVATVMK